MDVGKDWMLEKLGEAIDEKRPCIIATDKGELHIISGCPEDIDKLSAITTLNLDSFQREDRILELDGKRYELHEVLDED